MANNKEYEAEYVKRKEKTRMIYFRLREDFKSGYYIVDDDGYRECMTHADMLIDGYVPGMGFVK